MTRSTQTKIEELLHKQEELDPELQLHVEDSDTLGQMLRHPLVYSVPYSPAMNAWLNERLRVVKELIEKDKKEGRFTHLIWHYERPYRLPAFEQIQHELSDPQYWKTLASLWIDSENIFQHLATWIRCLTDEDRNLSMRAIMMDRDERGALRVMSDSLRIFRGCTGDNEDGLSWTIDPKRAEFFAKRFGRDGYVIEGQCQKSDIIAFFTGRQESEIVILPGDVEQ